ncbi:hypothetical protein LguiA_026682 [Lonicera macranthoides]
MSKGNDYKPKSVSDTPSMGESSGLDATRPWQKLILQDDSDEDGSPYLEKLTDVEQQLKKAEAAQRRRMQVEKAARESRHVLNNTSCVVRELHIFHRSAWHHTTQCDTMCRGSSKFAADDDVLWKSFIAAPTDDERDCQCDMSNTVRWIMRRTGIVATFPIDMGLRSILEPHSCCYIAVDLSPHGKSSCRNIEEKIMDICSLGFTLWPECSFLEEIDFFIIDRISHNLKLVHVFNEHVVKLEPPNSIKNNLDSSDRQSSEDAIIAMPLNSHYNSDANSDSSECNLHSGEQHLVANNPNPNSIKNNLDGCDRQSSEDTIVAVPLSHRATAKLRTSAELE